MNFRIKYKHGVNFPHSIPFLRQCFCSHCSRCILITSNRVDRLIKPKLFGLELLQPLCSLFPNHFPLITILFFPFDLLYPWIKLLFFPFEQFLVFFPLKLPFFNLRILNLDRHYPVNEHIEFLRLLSEFYGVLKLVNFQELDV